MNTPTHLLVNATIQRRWPLIQRAPFLLGSVLPDLPLLVLWLGWYVVIRHIQGDTSLTLMDKRLDQLYFTHPLWLAGHNVMHSPTLLLAVLAVLWRWRLVEGHRWRWGFCFAAGCLVHTALDIPSHVDDGPLLFFPLEWSIRFHSPISYWDPRYGGRLVAAIELIVDVALLLGLYGPWLMARWSRWRRARPAARQP